MRDTEWIKSQVATKQPLNLNAVARRRPSIIKRRLSGRSPKGWYHTLIELGIDPYKIVHEHQDEVECRICGHSASVLGMHLKHQHSITGPEYLDEFGADAELSSESYRAARFKARPIHGIKHWEQLWSHHYVIDWILRLREEGHALNFHTLNQAGGQMLSHAGIKFFGSWDSALQAAGLNPEEVRSIPPFQEWTEDMVIQKLCDYAEAKKANWRMKMHFDLRFGALRTFGSLDAARRAAGLKPEDISARSLFHGPKVTRLVAAIRKLEGLKGQARVKKLKAIYHRNEESRRIVQGHYGSLKKLAQREGIDLHAVSLSAYRDEADVNHELDAIEQSGRVICSTTLCKSHKRLYNVISETGWGKERLVNLSVIKG